MTLDREDPAPGARRRPVTPANWAKPVDRLSAEGVAGAGVDSVTGKRVTGPAPGIRPALAEDLARPARGLVDEPARSHRGLEGAVRDVLAEAQAGSTRRWPVSSRARSRCSISAPMPGSPVKTVHRRHGHLRGRRIVHLHLARKGHMLSGWITFSAYRDGDVTVAQVQALERTSDPFDELGLMFGGSRMIDRFWRRHAGQRGVGRWVQRTRRWFRRPYASTSAASGGTPPTSATASRFGRCATR